MTRRFHPTATMLRLALAACCLLLFPALRSSGALVHRWSFNEASGTNFADSVGGATASVVELAGGGGFTLNGSAIRLDGGTRASADYVALPGNAFSGLTNTTIEIWASPHSFPNWGRLIDMGEGDLAPNPTINNFRLSWSITTDGNTQRFGLRPFAAVDSALATATDTIYHYAIVWSATGGTSGGARIDWYRNGVYVTGQPDVGTNTIALIANLPQPAIWLARSPFANDSTANASYHEVRIYDAALPASMIASNFVTGPDALGVSPPNTVADVATLNPGASVLIPVLANDTGSAPNPATLEIITPPASGSAVAQSNGKVLYTHNGGVTISDSLTYRVQNYLGSNSAPAVVSLTITNGLRLAAASLAMPASLPASSYQAVNAFPGLTFEDALAIATPPGRTNQIFVCERRGIISYVPDINAATPVRQVFMDFTSQISFDNTVEGERGLLGLAFHPNFETNGYFYVFYVAPGNPYTNRLARFQADPVTLTVNTNTQTVFFDVLDQVFNHNGGDIHFGPDGYLYIGMGDEGNQYNNLLNSQRIDKDLFSAMLRIDVDKKPGNVEPRPSANTTRIPTTNGLAFYSIPLDNPFVNATNYLGSITNVGGSLFNTNTLRAEIFATGFRHIWRFSIDTNGDIWAGDVGQDRYEEVNIVTNGGNYGWAYFEGYINALVSYPSQGTLLANPPPAFAHATPLYAYNHTGLAGDAQFKGNSISGGVVYRGNRIPELNGAYIFGDFVSGNIWALRRSGNTVISTNRLIGDTGVAAFGKDPGNGDVLLANYAANQIQRLVKVESSGGGFPQKLSDTGAFADVPSLAPAPGMVNYEPIVSFWSDNAIKRRWFAQPNLASNIIHVADGNWTLPTGMAWVKHFDMELDRGNPASRKRLETRFIVKNTNSVYGVSYAWNDAGTEAYLVPDGGTNFNLTITNGAEVFAQQWGIPSRSDCMICHTEVGGRALSFNTRQLNQTATMNGLTGNQLAMLGAAGYFANGISAPQTLPAFAHATNELVSLEHRARSYFSVNCVQCHQPGGTGPSTWDSRAWLTLLQTGLINGTPYNNGANPANKLVVPGDTTHSVVLQRILGNGFSRMPPLATSVIDSSATNLLTRWINSELPGRTLFADWQSVHFGATNAPGSAATDDPDGDGANNYYEFLTQTSPLTNAPPPWTVTIDAAAGAVNVSFQRVANLGFLVETSADLDTWSWWNTPGNSLWFSASNFVDTVSGPHDAGETNRYFRVKIVEP